MEKMHQNDYSKRGKHQEQNEEYFFKSSYPSKCQQDHGHAGAEHGNGRKERGKRREDRR